MNAIEAIQRANSDKSAALAKLHTQLGYGSANDLASAILRASSASVNATPAKSVKSSAPIATPSRRGRRIPDGTREKIATALKAGETGYHLAAKFGVSYNIVHAVKAELGMVRPNKRTTKGRG